MTLLCRSSLNSLRSSEVDPADALIVVCSIDTLTDTLTLVTVSELVDRPVNLERTLSPPLITLSRSLAACNRAAGSRLKRISYIEFTMIFACRAYSRLKAFSECDFFGVIGRSLEHVLRSGPVSSYLEETRWLLGESDTLSPSTLHLDRQFTILQRARCHISPSAKPSPFSRSIPERPSLREPIVRLYAEFSFRNWAMLIFVHAFIPFGRSPPPSPLDQMSSGGASLRLAIFAIAPLTIGLSRSSEFSIDRARSSIATIRKVLGESGESGDRCRLRLGNVSVAAPARDARRRAPAVTGYGIPGRLPLPSPPAAGEGTTG